MDNNYFTPFGARVEAPPVITIERRSRIPYKTMLVICCISWWVAAIAVVNVGAQSWRQLAAYNQQLAWDARR